MTTAQFCILAAIVIYLISTVLVGVYFSRKGSGESSDQFFLGGRKLGPIVTAMSAEASDMSSYLLMGLPGLAYLAGVAEVGWTVIGLAVGTYLNWLIVAKRLRRYSARLGAFTIPDYFSRRYGDERNVLACIAAIVILIFFVPYTASGFKAVGTLFDSLFGVDYHVAMIVGAVIMGPTAGAVLGFFFGLSAIIKVLTMPGADPFATLALAHSPLAYLAVCMGARILMGWLSGLLAELLRKAPALRGKLVSYAVTGFVGSALNTVFYLGLLWALCAEVISSFYGVDLSGVGALVTGTAYAAGIPEAIVSAIVVAAVCKALERLPALTYRLSA